ncbi:MAG: hypothetical protein ACRDVW_00610 [Acidimicrobiales bacterium]
MTGPAGQEAALRLEQAAALLGAYCAIERRLFELTGAMAQDPEMPKEVQLYLDTLSAQHAWHAELWADRLPVVASIDAQALVVVPPPVDQVIAATASAGRIDCLAALFRLVLPRLVSSYSRHAMVATAVSEAPTMRALTLVLRDEAEEWAGGEHLVERVLRGPEAVASAGRLVVALESGLVASGIVPGLVPWPARGA